MRRSTEPAQRVANYPVAERANILSRFCDLFESQRADIATELTWQMGRPIRYSPSEVNGTLERARHMIAIAPQALADIDAGPKENFTRFVRREPLGVVLTIAAWNYPYLIAVNSIVPALMAGNAVILKHSAQTPLCAERFATCSEASRPARRRISSPASQPRGHRKDHSRPTHRLRRLHRLRRRRARRATRGLGPFHRRGLGARRMRSGIRPARRRSYRTPSRTSSTAPTSTAANRAVACNGSTFTSTSTTPSSTASSTSPTNTCSATRSSRTPRSAP